MEISTLQWGITLALILGLLFYDLVFHVRKPHEPTIRESAVWTAAYVAIALLFGLFILWMDGPQLTAEYYGGYITEKALSVDNLFVFLIIMASFKVPRPDQQKVLLVGIVLALIFRSLFIFIGAAAIERFSWVFYIFSLILIYTAGKLIKDEVANSDQDEANNVMVRLAKKLLPTTDYFDGDKLFTVQNGKKVMTPMLLVMVAIGGTDILFAFDSIPAIFGLTQEPYIVFTATAFSLMGLRQLYFLIDGLLDRLIYLSWGLSLILLFIGIKLMLHALYENSLSFINNGQPVPVTEISIGTSLIVIIAILLITVLASLLSPKGRALRIIQRTQDLSEQYLALPQDASAEERNRISGEIADLTQHFPKISEKHKEELIESRAKFRAMVETVHGQQSEFEAKGTVTTLPRDVGGDAPHSDVTTGQHQTDSNTELRGPGHGSGGGSSSAR